MPATSEDRGEAVLFQSRLHPQRPLRCHPLAGPREAFTGRSCSPWCPLTELQYCSYEPKKFPAEFGAQGVKGQCRAVMTTPGHL